MTAVFDFVQVIANIRGGKMKQEIVKAINTTTVGATRQALAKIEKREVDVLFVYGQAVGVKTGSDERKAGAKGEWSALLGNFWAVKVDDPNTVFESGKLFLPAGQEMIEASIVTGELDASNRPIYGKVEFAVMLVSEPAPNAHGYRWKLRNLIGAERPPENSVADRLLSKISEKVAPAQLTSEEAPAKA